jgi:hypothetical protein
MANRFFSMFYYCSSVWLTDMLPKKPLQRLTTASNSSLRAALGYKIKDISTSLLHTKANVLTPYQRSFYDKAMIFWKIIYNCEPECLFLDLFTQGFHYERQKTFYLKQNNIGKTFYLKQNNIGLIGRFSFENRLNNALCLLGDNWLDLSQVYVKRMLEEIILQNIPVKYV